LSINLKEYNMTVYDCTLFWNENDLYELRLNQHWEFVDKFIVVEAGETHTGNKKSFNFDHKRFEKYKSKIIYAKFNSFQEEIQKYPELLDNHSVYDRSPNGQYTEDWIRDHFQGNYPVKVLKDVGAEDDDIVYISALDEILNDQAFTKGKDFLLNNKDLHPLKVGNKTALDVNHQPILMRPSFGFMLDMYVFKFNLFCKSLGVAEMTQFSFLKKLLPSTIRSIGLYTHPNMENAGWHFSWLDDEEGKKVLQKQKNWAHSRDVLPNQKVKYTHTNIDEALERLFIDYEVEKVPLSPETHPSFLMNNLDKYKGYIYE
tara:strand:- start:365 stop:1309 length:945 start_codon:yes stop_codon:yes gene_type:complete